MSPPLPTQLRRDLIRAIVAGHLTPSGVAVVGATCWACRLVGDVLAVVGRVGQHPTVADLDLAPRYLLSALTEADQEAIRLARQLARHVRRQRAFVAAAEA